MQLFVFLIGFLDNSTLRGIINDFLSSSHLLPPIGKPDTFSHKLTNFNRIRWRTSDIDSIETNLRQALNELHKMGVFHGAVDENHILIEKVS